MVDHGNFVLLQVIQVRVGLAAINQVAPNLLAVQPDAFLANTLHAHRDNGAASGQGQIGSRRQGGDDAGQGKC